MRKKDGDDMSIDDPKRKLSAPLQQLMDEHISLRDDMDRFYEIAEEIEYESGPKVVEQFNELYHLVSAFNGKLAKHSKREDDGLFPMMSRHLGEEDRTIDTMEYEHQKAEQHLRDFLDKADQAGKPIDEDDAQIITVNVVQAYATLTQHFAKEETKLFPLADTILSYEEKEELDRLFREN